MPSGLLSLPAELIEIIALELEPPDVCSVRLTCRGLHLKSLYIFTTTCLKTFRTDLSYKSLSGLKELSEREVFRQQLQTLLVAPQRKLLGDLGSGFRWRRDATGALKPPLMGVQMLKEALKNHPGCSNFLIHCPYGGEENYSTWALTHSDVVAVLASTIAVINRPLKTFHIDLKTYGHAPLDRGRLGFQELNDPEFQKAWACVQELSMKFSLSHDTLIWTSTFISEASNLRKLNLHFDTNFSRKFFRGLCSKEVLPCLEELILQYVKLSEDRLTQFLLRFRKSLRRLCLKQITLSRSTWATAFATWAHTLKKLECIEVAYLNDGLRKTGRVTFPNIQEDLVVKGTASHSCEAITGIRNMVIGVRYQGPDVDKALEKFMTSSVSLGV